MQMIGFMEATQGEAIINGRNIKTDMNEIYTFMVRFCCEFACLRRSFAVSVFHSLQKLLAY